MIDETILIESKNSPQQRTVGIFKEVFRNILNEGKFVHCIDVFDQGKEQETSRYLVRVFTEPGLCKHSSINECVDHLEKINSELWFALKPELRERLEKIIKDRTDKEELKERYALHVLIIKRIFDSVEGSEKIRVLDEYIKHMVSEYPEYYTDDGPEF